MQCVACDREGQRRLCGRCYDRTAGGLGLLPAAYRALRLVEQRGGGQAERVSGSRTPGPPGRLDVLDARGPGGIASWAKSWEAHWRAARGLTVACGGRLEVQVSTAARWLRSNLEWVGEHGVAEEVREFTEQVHETLTTARAVTGTTPGDYQLIGRCPTVRADGAVCGAALFASPWADHITCHRCRSDWPRLKWLSLALAMHASL